MNASPQTRAYIQLHIAVFLFGFTAILGKLISLTGTSLVWYRMVIAALGLCVFPGIFSRIRSIPPKFLIKIAGIGMLVALHWVTFFEAIKLSNVSITLSCFASTAFFTALIEPLIFRRKTQWHEILLGVLVICGFVFIFGFAGDQFLTGMIVAIISTIIIAYAGVLNKGIVDQFDIYAITLVEFVAGIFLLALLAPIYIHHFPDLVIVPTKLDWGYLLVLGLGCTTVGYTLAMQALKHLSAYATALSLNLEPVYGILMAYVFFQENEELNGGFYIGTGIILLSVFIHTILSIRAKKKRDNVPPTVN